MMLTITKMGRKYKQVFVSIPHLYPFILVCIDGEEGTLTTAMGLARIPLTAYMQDTNLLQVVIGDNYNMKLGEPYRPTTGGIGIVPTVTTYEVATTLFNNPADNIPENLNFMYWKPYGKQENRD